ncbi:MAG: hypothetical protein IJE10_08470 [Clostridia bacterium]|nr:hypothetical protein [Clostridia bacterium]
MAEKLIGWDADGVFLLVETEKGTEEMLPDFASMTKEELVEYKGRIIDKIHALNEKEPKRKGEAFDKWEALHEELEDLRDEIAEIIDEM